MTNTINTAAARNTDTDASTLRALVETFNNREPAERFALARSGDTFASLFRPLSDMQIETLPSVNPWQVFDFHLQGDLLRLAVRIKREARAARVRRIEVNEG